MPWRWIFLFCFAAGAAHADEFQQNWGKGPVPLVNEYPLLLLHNSLTAGSPQIVDKGQLNLNAVSSWSNTSILEDSYRVDAEGRNLFVNFQYGVGTDWEASLRLPLLWRGGGVLDPLIHDYHDFWGLPQGDRNVTADNEYAVEGTDSQGLGAALEDDGLGFGNAVLGAGYLLSAGTDRYPALKLRGEFSLPTASRGYGHTGLDLLVGVDISKRYDHWIAYAGTAGLYFGDNEIQGYEFARFHWEGYLTFEYEYSERLSLLAGVIGSEASVENMPKHPEYWLYLDAGLKYALTDQAVLQFLFRENLAAAEGTTDFDALIGLELL